MKRIGIITINDNNNYGNRLQNYAVQEYLKRLGFEVETLINVEASNDKKKFILRLIKKKLKENKHNLKILLEEYPINCIVLPMAEDNEYLYEIGFDSYTKFSDIMKKTGE